MTNQYARLMDQYIYQREQVLGCPDAKTREFLATLLHSAAYDLRIYHEMRVDDDAAAYWGEVQEFCIREMHVGRGGAVETFSKGEYM